MTQPSRFLFRVVVCGLVLASSLFVMDCEQTSQEPVVEKMTTESVNEVVVEDANQPEPDRPPEPTYPPLDQGPKNTGPGGPQKTFTKDELYQNCSYLVGGEKDVDHHNILLMFDGYLLMPWAPESGGGGLAFYDIKDPCAPKRVGTAYSQMMRESHSVGIANMGDRWYAVVDGIQSISKGGVQFWDITDVTKPKVVADVGVPGFFYPDAYKRVVLSVFWQGRYVYAAGSQNGIFIIDALDPNEPKVVGKYQFTPVMDAGQVQVIGNLMVVITAEQARTVLLDVSDPTKPKPRPNGDFLIKDGEGNQREAYFGTTTNGYIFYARKEKGGGVIVYDIRDPSKPVFAGDKRSDDNGGYVYIKDNFAFTGESNAGYIYDISDLTNISVVAKLQLTGDLDTVTPIGNMVAISVDDKAEKGKGTALAPYAMEPDRKAPVVTWTFPKDKATNLATTSRIGLTFNEFIDPKSAWESSVRVYTKDEPRTIIKGWVNVQESIVNFSPKEPLAPNTTYILELPAGGIKDYNGNAIEKDFQMTFTTGAK